jgi:rod shape-determining protein MreC
MRNFKSLFRNNLQSFLFLLLIIICIFFLINSENVVLQKIKAGGHSIFSSLQSLFSGASDTFKNLFVSFDDVKKLKNELETKRAELNQYTDIVNEISELRKENNELRDLLGFSYAIPNLYDGETIRMPAVIIGKQPGNFSSTLIINKGEADGVKLNMPVIARYTESYGLVGKIVTVSGNSSMVMPLYNSSFFVSGRLERSNFEGLVNGLGEDDSHIIMQYVEKLAKSDINYGDLVVTSGTGLAFPKGIHIGTVNSIISKPYQTSMEIEIVPLVDFSRLQYVFVIDQGLPYGQ